MRLIRIASGGWVRTLGCVSLFECRAEIGREQVEVVDAVIATHGVQGWSVFEDVVAGRAWVIGIFADENAAREQWHGLLPFLPRRYIKPPQWRELPDTDWRESYKAHFKPWHCGRLHWIPEWERSTYAVPRGDVAVYLDPGLAFGTGNHETTRLCCRRLVEFTRALPPRQRANWRVIDAGCGSGILAISAAKVGCGRVFAFDNDRDAVVIARKNARRNQVASAIQVVAGDVRSQLAGRQAELVMANIQADVLVAHARDLLDAVAARGQLVLSGILRAELASVRAHFRSIAGRTYALHMRTDGEWSDLRLTAKTKTVAA